MKTEEALWNVLRGKCIPYKKASKNKLAEVVKENAELKRLLRLAVDDLMEFMNNLCESTEENSCYSPCAMCLNQFNCEDGEYLGVKWLHLIEAEKLLEGKEDKNP